MNVTQHIAKELLDQGLPATLRELLAAAYQQDRLAGHEAAGRAVRALAHTRGIATPPMYPVEWTGVAIHLEHAVSGSPGWWLTG